jgi:hypothetical protein
MVGSEVRLTHARNTDWYKQINLLILSLNLWLGSRCLLSGRLLLLLLLSYWFFGFSFYFSFRSSFSLLFNWHFFLWCNLRLDFNLSRLRTLNIQSFK